MTAELKTVLVTGFGPFGEHQINASWEAVSALPEQIDDIQIVKQQIPVAYKHVEENIPLLWQQYNPKLVVHVGVSSYTRVIQIETTANRTGYERKDVDGTCPSNGQAFCGLDTSGDCIKTELSTQTICERLSQLPELKAAISNDPGRYLCEFIYYVSLNQDKKRALFVHVPPLDQPYSRIQLAQALEEIIKCSLELINEQEKQITNFPSEPAVIYKNGRAAAF